MEKLERSAATVSDAVFLHWESKKGFSLANARTADGRKKRGLPVVAECKRLVKKLCRKVGSVFDASIFGRCVVW